MQQQYKNYIGSENNFQITVCRYLDSKNVLWFHPANERKTATRFTKYGRRYSPEGNLLKAKGVKPGCPDVLIFEPRNGFNGFALELKVKPNKLNHAQETWLKSLETNGWKTAWTSSLDEALYLIDEYLK